MYKINDVGAQRNVDTDRSCLYLCERYCLKIEFSPMWERATHTHIYIFWKCEKWEKRSNLTAWIDKDSKSNSTMMKNAYWSAVYNEENYFCTKLPCLSLHLSLITIHISRINIATLYSKNVNYASNSVIIGELFLNRYFSFIVWLHNQNLITFIDLYLL